MNKFNYILFLLLLIFSESCRRDATDNDLEKSKQHLSLSNTQEELPIEQFVKWVGDKENGLSKTKEISEMNYHLSFMPKECLAYMELKNENFTRRKFDETLSHYESMTYFNLRIELKGGQGELLKYNLSSPQQYNERINYMAFEMQKDIFLVQGNDTLVPGLFHFERIYEVAPFATVMLAFDNKKFNPDSEFTVVYNDRLFNKGYIKYNYKQKQLIDLPNLSGV